MPEEINVSRREILKKAGSGVASTVVLGAGVNTFSTPVKGAKEPDWCEDVNDQYRVCLFRPTKKEKRPNAPTSKRIYVGNIKIRDTVNGYNVFNFHVGRWSDRWRGERYEYIWLWESKFLNVDEKIRVKTPEKAERELKRRLSQYLRTALRKAKNSKFRKAIVRLLALGVGFIVSITGAAS